MYHMLEVGNIDKIYVENLHRRDHLVDSGIYQDLHNSNLQLKFIFCNYI
jgi:hypothetical protein